MRQRPTSLSLLDFGIAFIANLCALVATGISLRQQNVAFVFGGLLLIGLTFSWFMSQQRKDSTSNVDGAMMAVSMLVGVALFPTLNQFLPGGGYPRELPQSSVLSWMLVFGSFFTWRDSTLMFLVVPSIAAFGLVGAYDTFPESPAVFFLFLACVALLFARSNLRSAFQFAKQWGHRSEQLHRYEWSALAGPEWALASALVVIVLSTFGAPVIQRGVQGATANIRYDNPALRNIRTQNPITQAGGRGSPSIYRVGQGPYGEPSNLPVFSIKAPSLSYIRTRHYALLQRGRWVSFSSQGFEISSEGMQDQLPAFWLDNAMGVDAPREGARRERFEMLISATMGSQLALPSETTRFVWDRNVIRRSIDGSITSVRPVSIGEKVAGVAFLPRGDEEAGDSVPEADWPRTLRTEYRKFSSTSRVSDMADKITAGITSDWEKALAIQDAVSKRITYNLQAPAVPEGQDPSDYVLFEQNQGYCDLFATAVVELARASGLTARVASGYLVDRTEAPDSSGAYVVRDRHAHMWSEIYFENAGWVPIDATEGATEVPGSGRGDGLEKPKPWWERLPLNETGRVIGIAVAAAALAGILWAAYGFVRQILKRRQLQLATVQDPGYLQAAKVIYALEKASKLPRRFEQTVREYVSAVTDQAETSGDPEDLIVQLEAALYGPTAWNPAKLDEAAKNFLDAFRRSTSSPPSPST